MHRHATPAPTGAAHLVRAVAISLAAWLAVAVLLTACGGGGDDEARTEHIPETPRRSSAG